MFQGSEIFEKHYTEYMRQISAVDFETVADMLGMTLRAGDLHVSFLGEDFRISKQGITGPDGGRPGYVASVILAKYILRCPERLYLDAQWTSFKDFKREAGFVNVNFFTSDTRQAILKSFAGHPDALLAAGRELGGTRPETQFPYDICLCFEALPRIALLLLFNDGDAEFPAQCTVLFQKQAEFYLDPESLAMTGSLLAKRLKKTVEQTEPG